MVEIRKARAADKDAIQAIALIASGTALDNADLKRLFRANGMFVAEEEAQILGFGGVEVIATEHLRWLYVLPESQRHGIGSKILKQLEEIVWQAGLSSLRVHSAPGAIEFYRRHGYREVAGSDPMNHDHEGVEMMKELNHKD